MRSNRKLSDLISVGQATLKDLEALGIFSVEQLAEQDAGELYQRLCAVTNIEHNICCLDVFRTAIEQAKHPDLPREQCDWWYWSSRRGAQ